MNKYGLEYEAPKAVIYKFDDNDRILTESGIPDIPSLTGEFAANVLNKLIDGISTTFEGE